MGYEAQCLARWGEKQSEGQAQLETDWLDFRGEHFRLKIPLADMRNVVAADGVLALEFAGGSASFKLGERAAKWAAWILHPPSRLDKLGVRAGLRVLLVNLDEHAAFADEIRARGARIVGRGELAGSDLIFLGAETGADLAAVKSLAKLMAANGALWVIYPKGRKAVTEREVLSVIRGARLVDTKVARYSATHTAVKAMIPKIRRGARGAARQ